ncbi:heme exporter protein CcmD [Nitratireductor pacificus]|uniref:Heme exporter protein D n=1 Tax=Nitratireductor pacificus pht-3B TaxID=391937 RepID=K2LLP6_9HYPH|nr:heme exporter protein CcmD [Nitratireductor pacificus]EKF18669.1 thioredoxin-related cycX 3' region protein, inner membrane protein [Nitratireductor pacificus pht-3B]
MTHAAYVFAAYGISALVIAAVGIWILIDQASRKRELKELEQRGIRRRSERREPGKTDSGGKRTGK